MIGHERALPSDSPAAFFEMGHTGFGEKRKSGARKVQGCEGGLYSMRDLKVRGLGI